MENENLNTDNSDLSAVISWRSCLNDSPELGQEVEILHDTGDGTKEVIKHKWTGWENIQWVMVENINYHLDLQLGVYTTKEVLLVIAK